MTYYSRCENERCGKFTEVPESEPLPQGWCQLRLYEAGPLNTVGKAYVVKTLCGDCSAQIHRVLIERLSR